MDPQRLTEWLTSMPPSERIKALVRLYSSLTVRTRQLFLPDVPKGNEQLINNMLRGVNELHHTLSNQLSAYLREENSHSLLSFSRQLQEIATQYKIEGLLASAIEFVQTYKLPEAN